MKTPHTPREDRQKIAVIYAKYSRLIRGCGIPHEFWDSDVVHDLEFKFVSTATEDNGIPIPEGLETLGLLTMSEFDELLGSSQVVVGLGTPKISPSVFSSLCVAAIFFVKSILTRLARCQGPPVVLPMFSDYTDDDEGRFWGL